MHSFTTYNSPELLVREPQNGEVYIGFGEFGWGYDSYTSPQNIASYIATRLFQSYDLSDSIINSDGIYVGEDEKILHFEDVIKKQTGAEKICYDMNNCNYYPFGYIDHQSHYVAEDMFADCFDSIFKGGKLVIDHDNH